jgi:hypothetical protein
MSHSVNLTLSLISAIYVQIWLMLTLLLFIVYLQYMICVEDEINEVVLFAARRKELGKCYT